MKPESSAGVLLGPFALHRLIGEGGMGEVWLGEHREQGVPVAVKIIHADRASGHDVVAAFGNEVRAVARLDHPGIVRVVDCGRVDVVASSQSAGSLAAGSPFLAMELLDGGALDPSRSPGSWAELRATLLALLDALAHAHSRGVLHRDLKPSNVLYAGSGNDRPGLRITDFGIAHALGTEATEQAEVAESTAGTPHYMAPEQHHSRWRDYGPWTDLYGLGCIAWELATGQHPFDGDTLFSVVWSHLNDPLPTLEARLELPRAFEDWVARLLDKRPGERFQRAADAAFALRELDEGHVWGLPPLPETWKPTAEAQRTPLRLGGAGLGLHGLRPMPLLGRDSELDAAWASLRSVWSTAGPRGILLRGGRGCGKSRVAEYLCERADEVGAATVLRVSHDPMPTEATGLRAMLLTLTGCRGLSRQEMEQRLEEKLSEAGHRDPHDWQGLAELMAPRDEWGLVDGELPGLVLDPAHRNSLIQRLVCRLSADRPVILWMDDVQWGSPALSLAEHLLRAPPASVGPLLMLLTVRDDELPGRASEARRVAELVALPRTLVLELPPLEPEACARLVGEVLGLEGELASTVELRSEGNPQFAVHLVGDWVRRGLLRPGDVGFHLGRGSGAAPPSIPEDIHRIGLDRIERVVEGHSEDALQTLELAAALGLQVDPFEWNHACSEARLHAQPGVVDTLLNEGLAEAGEGVWSFASEMLRASLERSARAAGRWAELNGACARMLRRRNPRGGRALARRLAFHLQAAGDLSAAADQLGEAVWERVVAREFRDALHGVEEWERLLERSSASESDRRWGECRLVRSGALLHLGRLEEALEDARAVEVLGARHGWPAVLARALGQQGVVARLQGDVDEAVERWQEALRLTPVSDLKTRARLLYYLASVARQEGAFARATSLYEEALELYGRARSRLGETQVLLGLGGIAQDRGDLETAEQAFSELKLLFEGLGSHLGASQALSGLAEVAHLRGNLDVACSRHEEAGLLLESIGSPGAIDTKLRVALIHASRHDLEALDRCLHRIESRAQPQLLEPWRSQLLVFRLPLIARRQDWAAWDKTLAEAREQLARRRGSARGIAAVARIAGEMAVERGQIQRGSAANKLSSEPVEPLARPGSIAVIDGLLDRLPPAPSD